MWKLRRPLGTSSSEVSVIINEEEVITMKLIRTCEKFISNLKILESFEMEKLYSRLKLSGECEILKKDREYKVSSMT